MFDKSYYVFLGGVAISVLSWVIPRKEREIRIATQALGAGVMLGTIVLRLL